jgi:elongation factor Tu
MTTRREFLAYSVFTCTGTGIAAVGKAIAQSAVQKPLINVGVIGHIDHGKTTLCAALSKLFGDSISYEEIDKATSVSVRNVKTATANVAFETEVRRYALFDCPGNADYVKGMITGILDLDAAILVVNAADGPMPQTREHVVLAARSGIKSLVIYLNKADQVDDPELIELVEMETRELVSYYGYPGDEIPVVAGSAVAVLENQSREIGDMRIQRLVVALDDYVPTPDPRGLQSSTVLGSESTYSSFEADIYFLTKQEGGWHEPFVRGYSAQFNFPSAEVAGVASLKGDVEMVMPGDVATMTIELNSAVAMEPFLHFYVIERGRTVGIGVAHRMIK